MAVKKNKQQEIEELEEEFDEFEEEDEFEDDDEFEDFEEDEEEEDEDEFEDDDEFDDDNEEEDDDDDLDEADFVEEDEEEEEEEEEKPAPKKAPAKKTSPKKEAPKKTPAKKAETKKETKKTPAKKAAPKKAVKKAPEKDYVAIVKDKREGYGDGKIDKKGKLPTSPALSIEDFTGFSLQTREDEWKKFAKKFANKLGVKEEEIPENLLTVNLLSEFVKTVFASEVDVISEGAGYKLNNGENSFAVLPKFVAESVKDFSHLNTKEGKDFTKIEEHYQPVIRIGKGYDNFKTIGTMKKGKFVAAK